MGLWWKGKISSMIPMKQSVINVKTVTSLSVEWSHKVCKFWGQVPHFFRFLVILLWISTNISYFRWKFAASIAGKEWWSDQSLEFQQKEQTNKQSQDWHWWWRWWQACSSRRRRRRPPPPPPTCSSASPSSRAVTDRWDELLVPENLGRYILSSPRAGPKGLRAESARAVTGRRCPQVGRGKTFWSVNRIFFTKTAVTPERKVKNRPQGGKLTVMPRAKNGSLT